MYLCINNKYVYIFLNLVQCTYCFRTMDNTIYKDLMDELQCSVCSMLMLPPIVQCVNGHSVCVFCRVSVNLCKICNGVVTDARNFALENLSSKMVYHCKNANEGCNVKLSLDKKLEHEQICSVYSVFCEYHKCLWKGKVFDLSAHWKSKKNMVVFTESKVQKGKLYHSGTFVNLMSFGGKLFWMKCYMDRSNVSWVVQSIEKEVDPDVYFFEIEVFKKDDSKKKLLMSQYCSGLQMGWSSRIFESGFTLSKDYLRRYAVDNEILYRTTIKKDFGKKANNGNQAKETRTNSNQSENNHSNIPCTNVTATHLFETNQTNLHTQTETAQSVTAKQNDQELNKASIIVTHPFETKENEDSVQQATMKHQTNLPTQAETFHKEKVAIARNKHEGAVRDSVATNIAKSVQIQKTSAQNENKQKAVESPEAINILDNTTGTTHKINRSFSVQTDPVLSPNASKSKVYPTVTPMQRSMEKQHDINTTTVSSSSNQITSVQTKPSVPSTNNSKVYPTLPVQPVLTRECAQQTLTSRGMQTETHSTTNVNSSDTSVKKDKCSIS